MRIEREQDFINRLIKQMQDISYNDPPKNRNKKTEAKQILTNLENDPELFREFNLLLRRKKIKKIRDG